MNANENTMNNENKMPIMNGTGIKLPVMEKASYVPIGIIASIIWHLNTMESYRNALMQCHLMETV